MKIVTTKNRKEENLANIKLTLCESPNLAVIFACVDW